tara:strand:- start:4571 stop:4819 length:249 start_codon:yes stop_codon:yes gene_type:complete
LTIVEPIDPFYCRVFHSLEAVPWATAVNDLGLEEAIDRFCQSIVIRVSDAADRWFNARLRQAFGVFDRQVESALGAAVRMVD